MGFEDAINKLNDLARNAERVDGKHSVPFNELFTDEFMMLNTEFQSMELMLSASGFKVERQEDFAAIPDDQWDAFVREHTRFGSWKDMSAAAGNEWVSRQLGLDR